MKKAKKIPIPSTVDLLQTVQDLIILDIGRIKEVKEKLSKQQADDLVAYGRFLLDLVKNEQKITADTQKKFGGWSAEELAKFIAEAEGEE